VVGIVTPLVAGPYFGSLLAAIATEVARAGGQAMAIQAVDLAEGGSFPRDLLRATWGDQDPAGACGCPPGVSWDRVSGIIGLMGGAGRSYLEGARAAGKPVVLVSYEVAGFVCPVVRPDNRAGATAAVTHLLGHGRKRIAFAGNLAHEDIRERYAAYQDHLRSCGLEPAPDLFFDTMNNDGTGGRAVAAKILQAGVPCDAVVVATDFNAVALMDSLVGAGVRVPEDVAVVSFDNSDEGALSSPPLTSVNLQLTEVAGLAADLVLRMVSGRDRASNPYVVPVHLVVRGSCGCSSHADSETPTSLLDIAEDLELSLADGSPTPSAAAPELVGALARHFQGAKTPQEMATLPVAVIEAMKELFSTRADMAAAINVNRAIRQVASELRHVVAPQSAPGVEGLLDQLTAECTRVVLHNHAVTMSGAHDGTRDWFDISVDLLRGRSSARTLDWLAQTEAIAGCLGLWTSDAACGDRSLEVVGTFNMSSSDDLGLASPCYKTGAFPPVKLCELEHDPAHHIPYVLPVKTAAHDWGVLAVLGPVWHRGTGSRDVYYEWSALLALALDHEQTMLSLREERENLAQLAERQTALASAMQKNGERYALALRASNEGLLDWQLATGQVYYSRRFLELLGFNASVGPALGTIDDWVNAVYDEDRPVLMSKLEQLQGPDVEEEARSFELEHRLVVGPDEVRWVLCKAIAARDQYGVATRIVGSLADISGRKGLEERLSYAALHDALTGLANRALLTERIRQALDINQRDRSRNFAVLWLDLDRFKIVNDSMGHPAGDALLKEVARRLTAHTRPTDTAGRTGGDEFVVLVNPLPRDPADLERLAQRLQEALAAPFVIEGHEVSVSASVGVVTSTMRYNRTEDILRDADVAMYSAKQTERGSRAMFTAPMRSAARGRLQDGTDLRHALDGNQLVLHYQPIVELATERLVAIEALVRWPRPDGRITLPAEFLPTAREAGLMPQLGELVLAEACTQQARWDKAGLLPESALVTVNVSQEEFWHSGFLHSTDRAVIASGSRRPVLEITEDIVMYDRVAGLSILHELRSRGFHLYVDDFGTGRSSLEALRDLPVEALKIDRSFISDLAAESKSAALVKALVQMAQALGLAVIAEGIETAEAAHLLLEVGCQAGQGYWNCRPLPAAEVTELLKARLKPRVGSTV
jgi:diguanylate cyclase (GGDEF)-like protein